MDFYYNKSTDLLPNTDPQSRLEKIVQFPLVRLFIILLMMATVFLIFGVINSGLRSAFDESIALYLTYLTTVLMIAATLLVYRVYTNSIENREAWEISLKKIIPELSAGWLLGFGSVTFIVSILALMGYYRIDEFQSFGNVVYMFFDQLKVGFIEELLFRVIIFKLTEEVFGSWVAIAFQGVLFGFAHSGNPNASIYSSLALIFSFTIFFGAGYMITRRLWFIMSFHWSWNFFQAGVFGMQNSGHVMPSLIDSNVQGPEWITGGEWGLEMSVLSMVLLFGISIYFVKLAYVRNQFLKPMWRR